MIKISHNLKLDKIKMDDAVDLFKYASNPNVSKFLPWDVHKNIEESKYIIMNFMNWNDELPNFGIYHNNKMIGTCGASNHNEYKDYLMLGYALSEEFWGMGIMTLCTKAFISWAKKQGIKKFAAWILSDKNKKSVNIITKCNFVKTKKTLKRDIGVLDLYLLEEKTDDKNR